jgi:hypothetical protein
MVRIAFSVWFKKVGATLRVAPNVPLACPPVVDSAAHTANLNHAAFSLIFRPDPLP